MSDKVTENDLNMVYYYHFEKGDINRWSQWKERKPIIAKEFPELIWSFDRIKEIEQRLITLIEGMTLDSQGE